MIDAIRMDSLLPPVILQELPDGSVEIVDGHHRYAAYHRAGRKVLNSWEYELNLVEFSAKRKFGKLTEDKI